MLVIFKGHVSRFELTSSLDVDRVVRINQNVGEVAGQPATSRVVPDQIARAGRR